MLGIKPRTFHSIEAATLEKSAMFFDGVVAIWDNLTTVYAAVSDDLPRVRTMERISIMGGELVT